MSTDTSYPWLGPSSCSYCLWTKWLDPVPNLGKRMWKLWAEDTASALRLENKTKGSLVSVQYPKPLTGLRSLSHAGPAAKLIRVSRPSPNPAHCSLSIKFFGRSPKALRSICIICGCFCAVMSSWVTQSPEYSLAPHKRCLLTPYVPCFSPDLWEKGSDVVSPLPFPALSPLWLTGSQKIIFSCVSSNPLLGAQRKKSVLLWCSSKFCISFPFSLSKCLVIGLTQTESLLTNGRNYTPHIPWLLHSVP